MNKANSQRNATSVRVLLSLHRIGHIAVNAAFNARLTMPPTTRSLICFSWRSVYSNLIPRPDNSMPWPFIYPGSLIVKRSPKAVCRRISYITLCTFLTGLFPSHALVSYGLCIYIYTYMYGNLPMIYIQPLPFNMFTWIERVTASDCEGREHTHLAPVQKRNMHNMW